MYISSEFVDAEGLKVLFPSANQDHITEMFEAGCFGTVTNFSGSRVVDRAEAERAGKAVFQSAKQQSAKMSAEPEKPKYSPTDQAIADNARNIIQRYEKSGMDQDRYRVLCAHKRLAQLEKKYNTPAPDKKSIQAEIDSLEQRKRELAQEAEECHRANTPVPARVIDHTLRAKFRINELTKQLNS
jgi:hypothetical protein